ncbi:MAG TPA: copper oxidase [Thermoanaerobaculia bacterium]|nr:copper oxidase [Thermoanaerobaculia bacterium]
MHPCLSASISTHRSAKLPAPRQLTAFILSGLALFAGVAGAATPAPPPAAAVPSCTPANTVSAHVVALDQQFWLNRLGASQPGGMIFALERDVVPSSGTGGALLAGKVKLRDSKRPRPLVLRVNVGDCLDIHFTNLLNTAALSFPGQTTTREAGVHVMGMPVRDSILSDASYVGLNTSSLVSPVKGPALPAGQITYHLYAEAEGTFLLYSSADTYSNGLGGQLSAGLFGAVNVQPRGAEWYRSQVTREELELATKRVDGKPQHTPDGQPLLDYAAIYPAGSKWPDGTPIPPGTPVLRMLDGKREIVASDLTALITGPRAGNFPESPDPVFRKNAVEPNRNQPYREFTLLYHEIFTSVQAFPEFTQGTAGGTNDPTQLGPTLGNGADAFAINYGAGGIAAEILANRLGVGPSGHCVDCKFEEFFLSAWATGDPATVVDVPANNPCTTTDLENGTPCGNTGKRVPATGTPFKMEPIVQAHKAVYPDDPSNVYHSYLNDHVKMRVLHAGSFIAHVHHLHAHQWLHTPNSDESTYLDSQLITPGTSYTLEIAFGGSGNLNKTAGDSIFHCHFYPHFAGGMWALWRVHDTFEDGTQLDPQTGIPVKGARALPDGEIAAGTPIPGLVPIPTLPMAPEPAKVAIVPETVNGQLAGYKVEVDPGDLAKGKTPGYPFFVPGVAGHRAPHPPMDFAKDPASGKSLDGGLPRHLLLDGDISNEHHNQWDFSKDTGTLVAQELPEDGTPVEKAAMAFSSTKKPWVPTFTQANQRAFFEVNGLPSVPGAPFANPARQLNGDPVPATVRRYKGADLQTDVVFSKKGWHYPQERHITLWDDVAPTVAGTRPPEPLFLRANSKTDVVEYWMTNLVPGYYELDDFQVRTPTDILGQHIHLVKFDVLASDGAANGFNYEDGSLSPDEVRERISGIRKGNKCTPNDPRNGSFTCPVAQAAPAVFGKPPEGQDWTGAQTTIQRWYADPVLNNQGDDRTLRTVFTHDHFGPSTHQQAGLYAGLLVEPTASTWRAPAIVSYKDGKQQVETDVLLGSRDDGGPTSWQADILTRDPKDSYREFALEFQDTALAYNSKSPSKMVPYPVDGKYPTNANGLVTSANKVFGWADCVNAINPINNSAGAPCPTGGNNLAAWPGIITGGPGSGDSVTNYRTEPLPFRVAGNASPNSQPNADLSQVYRSIPRQDAQLNRQPYGPIAPGSPFIYPGGFLGADELDPYTPLLRTYQGDKVQVRILTGAHVAGHFFTLQGLRWLFEPSYEDSGYVSTQGTGLSEHFEPTFSAPRTAQTETGFADYLYVTGAGQADQVQGMWGLLRSYDGSKPQEGLPLLPNNPHPSTTPATMDCPAGAPVRKIEITAVAAAKALASGQVPYNARGATATPSQTIQQPDGLLYVQSSDLNPDGTLKPGVPVEPLVLRAAAGECVRVTLNNGLVPTQKDRNGNPIFTTALAQAMGDQGDTVNLYPSWNVGLRAQLVSYDVTRSGGYNVGHNPVQTVEPGKSGTFLWYAGINQKPAELGTSNLLPSDPLMQDPLGLIGALVVEPPGATERTDANSRAAATILVPNGASFREIVLFTQSDLQSIQTTNNVTAYVQNLSWGGGTTLNGINDRTEPMAYRQTASQTDLSTVLSNSQVGGRDPQTPVFAAPAGRPVRFRLAQVSGTGDAENLTLHGHVWQEEPFQKGSTVLGDNPLSEWFGTTPHGPENNANILLRNAGGPFQVPGDYLFRSFFAQGNFSGGEWGIFRVLPPGKDSVVVETPGACPGDASATCVSGTNTVNPETGKFAATNTIYSGSGPAAKKLGTAAVDPATGAWSFKLSQGSPVISVQTGFGASATTAAAITLEALPRLVPLRPHTAAEDARERRALTFLRRRPVPPPPAPTPEKGDH